MFMFWNRQKKPRLQKTTSAQSQQGASPWDNPQLIREELFGMDRLEAHAKSLALAQAVVSKSFPDNALANRLKENSVVLLQAHQAIAVTASEKRTVTPAGRWMLDNYHVVEAQIRQIHDDLPPGFYRELPKLAQGHLTGYPRVLGIAWAYLAHTDSRFEPEMLCRFVQSYQQVQPLTIGELWAVPITLRVLLVENLRRAAETITRSQAARYDADHLANRILQANAKKPQGLQSLQAHVKHDSQEPLPKAFAVQLIQRLRDQDPKVTPALIWLEECLAKQETTMDDAVREEHQKQGTLNITVQNIVTSMRLISDVDWAELFERVSPVDALLRESSHFTAMDFPTRDLYRRAIEELAKQSGLTEIAVTQKVLSLASNHQASHKAANSSLADVMDNAVCCREADPGYYLLMQGRRAFEKDIGFRVPLKSWPRRFIATLGVSGYVGSVLIVTAFILSLPLVLLFQVGIQGLWLTLFFVFGALPSLDAAIALVNRAITKGISATLLPALKLSDGIPKHLRTMVVIPTLLSSPETVKALVGKLEIHHLANPKGELYFALLSDWMDAKTETVTDDNILLDIASHGIAALNQRYGLTPDGKPRFYLFHRQRIWNEKQKQWMGWERKRGKLHEFNRLLRGAADTTFMPINGTMFLPPQEIRYVITLDSDTRLPLQAAEKLIGKMAHPLNRPRLDEKTGCVVEGHAVLQPRVTFSLPTDRAGSLFQRVFSSASGLDPYAGVISDVYQDLFDEGSYTGKGIYDVDAFESALHRRAPENTLLSHDLFEGIFTRSGLVSDIEVIEEFPARYDVASARQHRWARGDWQLLPWLITALHGRENEMPLLGLWKILDNLRRTLSAPASFLALLTGWLLPGNAALLWTGFVLLTLVLPILFPVFEAIVPRHDRITVRSHVFALGKDVWLAFLQALFLVAFLPHQTWLMTDAIGRTLFRLFVRQRNLLEWVTAAESTLSSRLSFLGYYRQMGVSILFALLSGGGVLSISSQAWPVALPFLVLWILSPAIAQWTSVSPQQDKADPLSASDSLTLRQIARHTWRFFETFVTPADNMLPPDNFQEDPNPVLAHRTSPTNMGLYLLACVAAHDFGWTGLLQTIDRLEATLATMSRLEQFKGHFYNWYDTQDLRPLDPRYISAVDSGNLAGHLIALANACRGWREALPGSAPQFARGIQDNLTLMRQALPKRPEKRRAQRIILYELQNILDDMTASLVAVPRLCETHLALLEPLLEQAFTLVDIAQTLASERGDEPGAAIRFWSEATLKTIQGHLQDEKAPPTLTAQRLLTIETSVRAMVDAMAFGFLVSPNRKLLSIGYLVGEDRLDESCYDLLASEARLASFMAIAKGDVPSEHWFRLGRTMIPVQFSAALVSWSGSMFEYLMPSLVMHSPYGSLLAQTNQLIVKQQMTYGDGLDLPWGISESAYNARDRELTYQYSNFGVPELGLKQGLRAQTVIAPYATALASMVEQERAVQNFERLTAMGVQGRYGFYEAVDYTRSRLPEGRPFTIVRAFMAHHQGMTIVALANTLLGGIMRDRFHAEPFVQAADSLLQEKISRDVEVAHPKVDEVALVQGLDATATRRIHTAHTAIPETHLLSNGRYAVMLTSAGSGYSLWHDVAMTRWREDATQDDWGSYLFLRDCETGTVWSAGYQPCGVEPDSYRVTFLEDRAEFVRQDGALTTTLDVLVSSEDDAEVRRVSIFNQGNRVREIDITSYAELVLAPASSDTAHPAFSKLFVQTEYLHKTGTLLATRRCRTKTEPERWAAHLSVVEGQTVGHVEVETDRSRFIGRGHTIRSPLSVIDGRPLSNTVGTVLDPIFALRRRVSIPPGATARIAFWTMAASSRRELLDLADKHQDANAFDRATALAWTQAQVQLRHLGIEPEEATLFQRLGRHVLYATSRMRPLSRIILAGAGGVELLWAHGISGDFPVVVVRIDAIDNISLISQLLRAHEYLRMKQLRMDLVILNDRATSYVQDLQAALNALVNPFQPHHEQAGAGGEGGVSSVFVLRSDLIAAETKALLYTVARVVLDARLGTLSEQLMRRNELASMVVQPRKHVHASDAAKMVSSTEPLEFFNGLGGFAKEGKEYVTMLREGQSTPAPWINVIANPSFGFQVSAEGSGYTWAGNSRENQLTPWSNDPVSDRPGEVFYVRDEDTGVVWGPTALPIRNEAGHYTARHGQGYSQFQHTANDIALELVQFVPLEDPIKISRLLIRNTSKRTRKISVTAYVEWVLGVSRSASAPFITTAIDTETGALFAHTLRQKPEDTAIAFMDLSGQQTAWTGDRRAFLGRNGSLDNPLGLCGKTPLSKQLGAGLDPCGVLQATVVLTPGETVEVSAFLGQAKTLEAARALVTHYRAANLDTVFHEVTQYWQDCLGTIAVQTPDRAMDILLNSWLLYQTLACRVWARSAFYQASGAYGFRDQLQDGMALLLVKPDLTRAHLLRAAARQFAEGDVQHWWLPSTGQGVRTHISDDHIWLAYATAHYIAITGDTGILEENVAFLEGPLLQLEQHDAFFQPTVSQHTSTLYDHCIRGLQHGMRVGNHGLPLIGTGDWNDGMNRVGELGQGESVWLGWLLHATLSAFMPLAIARNNHAQAKQWQSHANQLKAALEKAGWDGDWYRRGYFDDGTPLGSSSSTECQIDAIAQSWGVISGAADPARAAHAMASVADRLIRTNDNLALLFTPPFDQTPLEPGYIKGYPPGIRENGGQYTHAAAWSIIAFAMLGQGNAAAALFARLNPVNHTSTRANVHRYKVEPYVMAADVYSVYPHAGRGGWTWYTGAAGWMYRAGIESILGLQLRGESLHFAPCIPTTWPGFTIVYNHPSARYEITVENPQGVNSGIASLTLDGELMPKGQTTIMLHTDHATHHVRVVLG